MRNMNYLGQFVAGTSVLHSLDPRVKIASLIGLSLMILRGNIMAGTMISALFLCLTLLCRFTPLSMARAVKPVLPFLVLLFLVHLLFTKGSPIPPFPAWAVTVSYEGLRQGALVFWRFSLLILFANLLTLTTSSSELIIGMERLLSPLKILRIPSHDIALMLSMALRFMPTLLEEMTRIKEAQMARGAVFDQGPLKRRIRAVGSLTLPIILSSMRRADELSVAIEARGYRRGPRTHMKELRMSHRDYASIVVMASLAALHLFESLL